jgi:hypothetical protein
MYHEPLDPRPSRDEDTVGGAVLFGLIIIFAIVVMW